MAANTSNLTRANTLSLLLQLFTISAMLYSSMSAPINPDGPSCRELNGTNALNNFKNGMEVLRRVHEGKLFSVIRSEEDSTAAEESKGYSLNTLSIALNTTCKLRDSKEQLWALDAITGEQPDQDIRLLRYITDILIQSSCEWTKHILTQLYPSSQLHLQCTCEEIDRICDEFNYLSTAKENIQIIEDYSPAVSGEINWIQANLPQSDSSMPLLQRFVQYVHNEPIGL